MTARLVVTKHPREYWCGGCGRAARRSDYYDAFACETCNVWLESRCCDKSCFFCRKRPKRPFQVFK